MPHEFGRLPITYFQTLADHMSKPRDTPTRNDSADDDEDVKLVDVDELIRKGQTKGFVAP